MEMWNTIQSDYMLRHAMYYGIAAVLLFVLFPLWAYLLVYLIDLVLYIKKHKYKFLTIGAILFTICFYMVKDEPMEPRQPTELEQILSTLGSIT